MSLLLPEIQGFVTHTTGATPWAHAVTNLETKIHMGFFDGITKAFSNEEYAVPVEGIKATARHILVKTMDDADMILEKISTGSTFASLANEFSKCPSGAARGGSLGSFSPGTMVPEFDKVIFSPTTIIGEVVGPVQTKVR